MTLTLTPLQGVPLVKAGEDIATISLKAIADNKIDLLDGDILVYAQKIISKSEDRYRLLKDVSPSSEAIELAQESKKDPALVQLILEESAEVLRVRDSLIIVEHNLGFVCANAGIDHSNLNKGDGWVLLLPKDPDHSAQVIRKSIRSATRKNIGVLIIDSHGRAWRNGVQGISIGISGMPALVDQRGEIDLDGIALNVTTVGVADELAAGASLMMGQAAEGQPIVHVRGFPHSLRESNLSELLRHREQDLFR